MVSAILMRVASSWCHHIPSAISSPWETHSCLFCSSSYHIQHEVHTWYIMNERQKAYRASTCTKHVPEMLVNIMHNSDTTLKGGILLNFNARNQIDHTFWFWWVHAQLCLTVCNPVDCSLPAREFSRQEYWNVLTFPPPWYGLYCHWSLQCYFLVLFSPLITNLHS